MENNNREQLGFDAWFEEAGAEYLREGFSCGRVIEVNRGNYRVSDGRHEMPAELSGRLLFATEESTALPTVGDWVAVQVVDNGAMAIVHGVFPRKTLLKRKESGRKVDFQLIAANIDCGLVVQSADAFNRNAIERYLVMLNESGITPVVVVNKSDLLSEAETVDVRKLMAELNCTGILVNTVSETGGGALSVILEARSTYCLLGPSGVGKTSLLNRLLGEERLQVGEVRDKDGRGRHTTVRRQLVRCATGSIFIDTPGMRELGNFNIAEGMELTFEEIAASGARCRFRDCTHVHEEGCAVIAAVEEGSIDADRYRNYLKLRKESAFYDMSYRERRGKDKAFGKMVKHYKKVKRGNG